MPTEPQVSLDTRTRDQIDYDQAHANCIGAFLDALLQFERLETLFATLAGGDARIAPHVTIKSGIQSITSHINATALVKDGIIQDLIDKSVTISAL